MGTWYWVFFLLLLKFFLKLVELRLYPLNCCQCWLLYYVYICILLVLRQLLHIFLVAKAFLILPQITKKILPAVFDSLPHYTQLKERLTMNLDCFIMQGTYKVFRLGHCHLNQETTSFCKAGACALHTSPPVQPLSPCGSEPRDYQPGN